MKRYRVLVMPEVQNQIDEQILFIAEDSFDRAIEWAERLRGAIREIGSHPGFTIDQNASARLGEEIRRMTFERTYLVFYRIVHTRQVVEVIGFRHGMRLPREGEP